jgi:hypothetical protein
MRALRALAAGLLLAGPLAPAAALAVTSATFTFDFVTDPGDLADGPDFDVAGAGPTDDTGTSCDAVVMVMVDATGTPIDVDSFCLALATGLGGSDGDYGSFGTGYLPVAGPATYALYDLTAADLAALTGFGDSDQEYFDYVVANARFLQEQYLDIEGLASGTPFSLAPRRDFQCYQAKDLKSPKFAAVQDLPVEDAFATGAADVSKPYLVCAPAGVDGAAVPTENALCCYKMKGAKLSPPVDVEASDAFGTLQLELKAPKVLCTVCTTGPVPAPAP